MGILGNLLKLLVFAGVFWLLNKLGVFRFIFKMLKAFAVDTSRGIKNKKRLKAFNDMRRKAYMRNNEI